MENYTIKLLIKAEGRDPKSDMTWTFPMTEEQAIRLVQGIHDEVSDIRGEIPQASS